MSAVTSRFEALSLPPTTGNLLRFKICEKGRLLSYADVLDLWVSDLEFVDFYLSMFTGCGYASYAWETPAISTSLQNRDFEFVLHNAPELLAPPDRVTFSDFFDVETAPDGVVTFPNLGGDALLIVPSPYRDPADYSHLAAFYRDAPIVQQRALWRALGTQAKELLSDRPLWLSVAGGGVSWLHIRIDTAPKYYRYGPYRLAS